MIADRSGALRRMPGRVPVERVGLWDPPRLPAASELIASLLGLDDVTSVVADALDVLGVGSVIRRGRLAPLADGQKICGPAVTLRYIPLTTGVASSRAVGAETILGDRDLYGLARPGDVAVFDCSGMRDAAVMGGLSAAWATTAGISGCVVDGATRDTTSILGSGLPVWSADRTGRAARWRAETIELNGTVMIAGARLGPGDYVVADDDGVCIVPLEDFAQVVSYCLDASAKENELLAVIADSSDLETLVRRTGATTPD